MTAAPVRLLLLEDNSADAELLQVVLAKSAPGGFAVTHVERLADALARIHTGQFDVVLSDLGLPDSSGPATVQAVAARAPALPLVVLTGTKDDELGRAMIGHGAQDYLVKGESNGALMVRTLHYAIERKRLEVGLRTANEALAARVAERSAELEAANAILLANAADYRQLFDANPQPMYMYNPETLRFIAVNDAAVARYGWSRVEFLAMTLADIRPAGEIQRLRDHIARVRRENLDEAGFWRHRKKDGTLIDVEITSHAIEFGGQPARVAFAHDVTERRRAEEALRDSEMRFRSLTEMSSDFYWETDVEHRFTAHNASSKSSQVEIFQRGAQIGQRRWDIAYLSPDEAGWQAHRAVLDAHRPFRDFVFSRRGVDGAERHYVVSGDPVFDASGAFKGYRGVGNDITERRRREHELKLFRELIDRSSDGIQVVDPVTLRFIDVNDKTCRDLGYSRDELLTMSVFDIDAAFKPSDMGGHDDQLGKSDHALLETVHRRKDGSTFPVELNIARITLDRAYQIVVARDITNRKQTEEALRAAEEQFRGLVEQSIAGIYIIQDGKLVYVNPRLAQILGYDSAEELIGRDGIEVIAEKDRAVILENRRRMTEGDVRSTSYTFAALKRDGTSVEVGVHSTRATHRGRPAMIGMMQDISEKKRAEEEIRRYVAQLETAFMSTVQVATTLSEMRDPYTAGHERRVAEIAVAIGAELGFDARRLEGLRVAGYLHDIGKITIPSEILSKPGRLTPIEFKLIQGHPQASDDVLKVVDFPWPVADVALQHHERIDGSGYPQGLKGEAILLEARIMAVADVVEAMSSHRPYRAGLGIDKALAEIDRGRGTLYDAAVADACLKLFREEGYAVPA